ncbi:MAG: MarR family transcriptional regulator [Solirubrobacteraceae bacterium]|nr:MarR family transcriptional regulator [Solirubrobacteraceae bacterium]
MHPSMTTADPLTASLAGAMLLLMKGSQHEVMEITAEFDLSLSQLRILFILDHADHDLAVNEFADRLSLSMAATGRAIDGLHRHGLVSRREDAADRRVKRIALTDDGHAATSRIAAARVRSVQRVVDALSPDEREQLEAATNTLTAVLANHLPAPSSSGCATPAPSPAAAATETAPARSEQTA